MTTARDEDYVPPPQADVVTFEAQRIGVTNGLLLTFPRVHAVGDLSLIDRPRVAIVGARKASVEGRRRAAYDDKADVLEVACTLDPPRR